MWPEDYVEANGIRLHYHRTGGDKPPVVLVHGFSDNGLCWTPVARALEADYDLIMYDARGHGLSDRPEHGYSPDHHADDLAGLVRALGLDAPAILGHSMGACTTAMAAARYPDLMRAALLEDPPFFAHWATEADAQQPGRGWFRPESDDAPPFGHWLIPLREQTVAEMVTREREVNPQWPDGDYEPWAQSKLQFNMAVLELMQRNKLPPSPPWKTIIAPITCPILLITGEVARGGLVTPEVADELRQTAADARVAHISDAGHSVRRDQFDNYAQVVRAFLAEVYAP